jgi:hypothetical protein
MSSIGCIFIAQCTESFCVVVLCIGENFSIYHQNPPFVSAGGGGCFYFIFSSFKNSNAFTSSSSVINIAY